MELLQHRLNIQKNFGICIVPAQRFSDIGSSGLYHRFHRYRLFQRTQIDHQLLTNQLSLFFQLLQLGQLKCIENMSLILNLL